MPLPTPTMRPAAQAAAPSGPSPWLIVGLVLGGLTVFEALKFAARRA